MSGNFPESRVVKIWRDQLPGRTDLVTEEGESVTVVYPGRLNRDRGADYRDAVIATGHGLLMGDVEIHVKSSSWWGHRHHRDPVYNRVVLHVVFWHDTAGPVNLQNGKEVPTLALHRYIGEEAVRRAGAAGSSAGYPLPCRGMARRWDIDFTGGILDAAGEERFLSKVAGFGNELSRTGAGQSLYRGIMGALGYSKNKQPMAELADRMPLQRLQKAITGEISDAELLMQYQARLMGTAGLLPSLRTGIYPAAYLEDDRATRLEKVWADCGETTIMSENDWHFFKVRPGNTPALRIAAMCHLLLRYRREGIMEGLLARLEETVSEGGYRDVERALMVTAESHQGDRGGPGQAETGCFPALLGRGRAAAIAVNVLLPFTIAYAQANNRPELAGKAREIYHHYPVLPDNNIQRHMVSQLGIGRYMVSTARRQQGLLHIYRTLCSQGRCGECAYGGRGS